MNAVKHMLTKISGLNIDIEYKSDKIAQLCRDYVTYENLPPDIKADYDAEKCATEAKISGFSETDAEFACIYRQIAEELPNFSRAVCHGAVLSYKQNGYMFIAKSGTGKTTHVNLWRKYIEGVEIVNGDKPIIEIKENDIIAYGTPWAGKEGLQTNTCVPLKGICLIKQADKNSIRRIDAKEAITAIIRQIYMPKNTEALSLTVKFMDDIIRVVPFYELLCNISREAAICSFNAMTKEKM